MLDTHISRLKFETEKKSQSASADYTLPDRNFKLLELFNV